MFIAVIFLLTLVSIFICHGIAKNRGANPVFWGIMGAFFGPLAIIFIFLFTSR